MASPWRIGHAGPAGTRLLGTDPRPDIMPIPVTCPTCHRTFRVPDRFAGRRGLCPDCQSIVAVPDEELVQLDAFSDEPDPLPRRRRRERPRRPDPRDHLPAWRRVATGYLVQQAAAALLWIGLALLVLGMVALADDPGNFQNEPTTPQVVAASLGMLALFIGFAVQAIGRLISAATPVRAPRGLGILSAIASALVLLGSCLVGFLMIGVAVAQEQGNPDEALATLGGLSVFGWMFLVAAGETMHGFAVGAVGRVLRSNGARVMGNGLGVFVGLVSLLSIFVFCGLAVWVGNNNPQNPDPDHAQSTALFAWMIGTGVVSALYLMLDLVLLQQGRSAVARIVAEAADDARRDEDWD